ncbi:MAG: hydrogenase iron-sulfur subunit [bacterium]
MKEPRIIAFLCNWCTYAASDLAGTSRLKYPENIRIVRVPCSGRIDFLLILKAFKEGADGVMVSGCHPGDCHYVSGNYYARRRFAILSKLLEFIGIEKERLRFFWISAAEGIKFADVVSKMVDEIKGLGQFERMKDER